VFDDGLNRLVVEPGLGHWDVNQVGFERALKSKKGGCEAPRF
jgi:hypothetical protein